MKCAFGCKYHQGFWIFPPSISLPSKEELLMSKEILKRLTTICIYWHYSPGSFSKSNGVTKGSLVNIIVLNSIGLMVLHPRILCRPRLPLAQSHWVSHGPLAQPHRVAQRPPPQPHRVTQWPPGVQFNRHFKSNQSLMWIFCKLLGCLCNFCQHLW